LVFGGDGMVECDGVTENGWLGVKNAGQIGPAATARLVLRSGGQPIVHI